MLYLQGREGGHAIRILIVSAVSSSETKRHRITLLCNILFGLRATDVEGRRGEYGIEGPSGI